jgi:hypothetical protein
MASRRSGKEPTTSSGGPPSKKRAPAKNHGITFKDNNQKERYKVLITKPLHPCRYPHFHTMNTLGIRDNAFELLNRLGWGEMLSPMRGYENFTYEFLSSIQFKKDKLNLNDPDHRVSFRLLNIDYEMSLENFCTEMGFANAGFIHDSWNQALKPEDYNPASFWTRITGLDQYVSRSNKASNIHNPVLRYLQRVMACTIWGRKEVGTCRTDEIFMLWAMLHNYPVNTCFYMLDYLASIGTKPNLVADIVVGGVITFIASKFGVSEEEGIHEIQGNNRLNIETLISMKFITHHPPMQYALKLNVPILFLLPNPSRTNTEVEENWLYVDNEQVHEQHDEGEGANLHHEEEHHDHNAGELNNDERWAWMRTEVERISTEQQRQGVELLGLRNDVQRGNRLSEENNAMLRRMMHQFNLQGPPYGPQ